MEQQLIDFGPELWMWALPWAIGAVIAAVVGVVGYVVGRWWERRSAPYRYADPDAWRDFEAFEEMGPPEGKESMGRAVRDHFDHLKGERDAQERRANVAETALKVTEARLRHESERRKHADARATHLGNALMVASRAVRPEFQTQPADEAPSPPKMPW